MLTLLAALAVVSPAILAQSDTLARILAAKKIRIALDPNIPPWSYKDDKLEMRGSKYETAKLLARDLGVALEMVPTDGANRTPQLITAKADIVVAALTITPERQKVIDFSLPYSVTTTAVVGDRRGALSAAQFSGIWP